MAKPFVLGFKATILSTPGIGSLPTALVQIVGEPMMTGLFYLLLGQAGIIVGGHDGGLSTIPVGNALAAFAGTCALLSSQSAAVALSQDRLQGIMPFTLLAVRHTASSWAGRIAALIALGAASGIASLVSLLAVSRWPALSPAQWGMIGILLGASLLSSLGFGLCIAAGSLLMDDAYFLSNLAAYVLPIIGGVIAPVAIFPGAVRHLLMALPITSLTQAARCIGGNELGQAAQSLGLAVVTGLMWAVLGVLFWAVCIRVQRRHNTIESLGF
jgi:ABC-2 type transport system permease protein